MIGAVAGAIAYATHRAALLVKSHSVPASPALKPTPPAPHPAAPPGAGDPDAPPLAAPIPELGTQPEQGVPRQHLAMVAPGVGPSSFAEEARALLPIAG